MENIWIVSKEKIVNVEFTNGKKIQPLPCPFCKSNEFPYLYHFPEEKICPNTGNEIPDRKKEYNERHKKYSNYLEINPSKYERRFKISVCIFAIFFILLFSYRSNMIYSTITLATIIASLLCICFYSYKWPRDSKKISDEAFDLYLKDYFFEKKRVLKLVKSDNKK